MVEHYNMEGRLKCIDLKYLIGVSINLTIVTYLPNIEKNVVAFRTYMIPSVDTQQYITL